jgi:hypothetical protein
MRWKARDTLNIEFSRQELEIINNALNEVCHGLDLDEFAARMGANKPEVLKVLHKVASVLQQ